MRRLLPFALPLVLCFALACSRETPAPASSETTTQATASTETSSPAVAPVPAAPVDKGTYDAAMMWLKSTPGFRFALDDAGVKVEGEMTRARVGLEEVTFKAGGEEWRGAAGPRGIVWTKHTGTAWKEATPPDYAGRIYQRVTFAFDPQKKEGTAQLASSDATSNVYRFTNANTGQVHEVRVRKTDGRIESMKIGSDVELTVR